MKNKNIFLTKFAIVAIAIGLFSPSININTEAKTGNGYAAIPMQLNVTLFNTAEARRARPARHNGNRHRHNGNRHRHVNHNNRYYGGRHYGYYRGRPLAAFTTALVVGTMVAAATMPKTCTTVITNGISYRRCGSSYYQPFYESDTLVYKVVVSPY